MIKIIIKLTMPAPTFIGGNDYFNHQRLHMTLALKSKNKQMKKISLSIAILSIVFQFETY